MEQNETGCEAPQAPLLCVNKCGFFGTAATMNMCSKCYKDLALNQEQANLAASSIQSIIVNGSSSSNVVENEKVDDPDASRSQAATSDPTLGLQQTPSVLPAGGQKNEEQGPKRCGACRKRVGLTGFTCRCGTTFCAVHRYTDKHDCQFDYRSAAQEAIAKANPVVKADKIDKI